jgi:prepilin-type N-terminal cleavage/methylation domain-containing protein
MWRRGDSARGFTLLEVLVALVVMALGAIGIMALLSSTLAAGRSARRLERARQVAVQTMEELRGERVAEPGADVALPPVVEGATYHRRYRVTAAGALRVVSVSVGLREGDAAAQLHMVRTTRERP